MKKILSLLFLSILLSCASQSGRQSKLLMATLWVQHSAEYQALCHQAYNIAALRLKESLAAHQDSDKPLAIVVDIDETLLDNSPYQGMLVRTGQEFNEDTWREWIARREAKAIAGSVDFIRFAHKEGVEVFYISNRHILTLEDTYLNLVAQGFMVKKENMLFKTNTSDKEKRRQSVAERYQVALLVGDNLDDFSHYFEGKKDRSRRASRVKQFKDQFGKSFIMLPNPSYGTWDAALYHYQNQWDFGQRDAIRERLIKSYK